MRTAGSSATSSSWPYSATIAAALVLGEATWGSLLLNAGVDTSKGIHVYLPFLGVAVPAVVASLVAAAGCRVARRWWWRTLLLAPVVVVGAALSAGVVAELNHGGLWWQVATRPWTVHGHPGAATAGVAWLTGALAWGRGTWVGAAPPTFRQAAWSVGIGGVAFLGVFAGRADTGAVAFQSATGPAGWLLFVGFPAATAAMALVRQRDLEKQVLQGAGPGHPGTAWFAVLAVPMAAVALVALLVAVTIGPAAPYVGRAVEWAAKGLGWLLVTPFVALWHLLAGRGPSPSVGHARAHPGATSTPPPQPVPTTPVHVPAAVGYVGLGLVVLVALGFLRHLRPLGRTKRREDTAAGAEERDSVFSWGHLAGQLRAAIAALFARRRRRPEGVGAPSVRPAALGATPESVRQAYRRVLGAATAAGHGRGASETPLEFGRRLAAGPAAGALTPLSELTDLYDDVRYGGHEAAAGELRRAAEQATVVGAALALVGQPALPSAPERERRPS